eukprot:6137061-Lingulodinium_polyedra.AAC.1
MGDFELPLGGSGFDGVLEMSGWTNVLADAGPTCSPFRGGPSRIDVVLANRAARARVTNAR